MSTDPSAAAPARFDAAAEESPPAAVALSRRVVAELAATIERLHSLIAADAMAAPDGSDAIERIADIAFVLHEREVEASLCDTLDAAVREISGGEATRQASLERMRKASEMLRELSGRLNEIIAAKPASSSMAPHEPASPEPQSQRGEAADAGVLPSAGGRSDSVSDDGAFAQAVVPLAEESGDRKSSVGEAAGDPAPCDEPAAVAASPAGQGNEARIFDAPPANDLDDPDLFATAPNDHPAGAAPIMEQASLLDLLGASSATADACAELFDPVEADAQTQGVPQPVPDAAESSQVSESAWLPPPSPDDDPADLFEPFAAPGHADPVGEILQESEQVPAQLADSAAAFARDGSSQDAAAEIVVAGGTSKPAEISADFEKDRSGQRDAVKTEVAGGSSAASPTGFDATSIFCPPDNDPLAPVKALSEDELIALFS